MKDVSQNESLSDVFLQQEMDASYGRLVLGIIHNIKNQLNAEKMALQHLSTTLLKVEHREEISYESELDSLRRLKDAVSMVSSMMTVSNERMLGITNSLLARSETQQSQKMIAVELNKIIKNEIEFLQFYPSFKYDTQTTLDLSEDELHIECFPGDLGQVIQNVLLNSIDAMRDTDPKELKISTRLADNRVVLLIQDNGPGISEEILSTLFQPFVSSKVSLDKDADDRFHGGSGLGIWVCRTLLETIGGNIEIESRESKGTTVSINLPFASPVTRQAY